MAWDRYWLTFLSIDGTSSKRLRSYCAAGLEAGSRAAELRLAVSGEMCGGNRDWRRVG